MLKTINPIDSRNINEVQNLCKNPLKRNRKRIIV
nr:MAG TPA: hypothetical protein [Caudoviricetes sp.]